MLSLSPRRKMRIVWKSKKEKKTQDNNTVNARSLAR